MLKESRGVPLTLEKPAVSKNSKIQAGTIQQKGARPARSLQSVSRLLADGARTQTKRRASVGRESFKGAENNGRDARAPRNERDRFGLDALAQLRRRAEARLRDQRKGRRSKAGGQLSRADIARVFHELQVHQVELEIQNAELQDARYQTEALLEKYTDLYDFAPTGYFSLDEQGRIVEANLTGAALLGLERSRLINRQLVRFVAPASQPIFLAFLNRVCVGTGKQVCEAALVRENAKVFWASFHGTSAIPVGGPRKWCRVAISDITSLKHAEEAQRRMEALAAANRKLSREIVRRQAAQESLKKSEQQSRQLLAKSRQMQEQLRMLSRQFLWAQEEERKRISRELHDVIAQTLTGINVRLAALKKESALSTRGLDRSFARTQQLVEHSVNIVHRFARELRPAVLDDLGLIPALHAYMKSFSEQTGIRVSLSASAEVNKVNIEKRTVLFRVAQEALNNVVRHAHASQAEVRIQKLNGAFCMKIIDNGKGFSAESALHGNRKKRLGLLGMRERVEMVRGKFAIESVPGKGTTILAQIPFADARGGGGLDS
jgi:PAS domain S-box-containing protein